MSDTTATRAKRRSAPRSAPSSPASTGIDGDADLALEAGLDSVEVMDLVMEIEDRLDVSIPVESLAEAQHRQPVARRHLPAVDGDAPPGA